ncbi:TPA: restriction endonuclease subunit S [Streptococcus suis]|nr:restriction endonuclease subunit S [Streptococcus suis]
MPNKDKNIPKRRFKAFENADAWELRKLGEVGAVAMCRRIFKEQTSEIGEIPFYKIGTFGGTPDAFISKELFEEYRNKYPYPTKGDILISASGSIGRTVEFLGKDEYFQDSNIVWLKHDGKIDNIFLKQFYSIVKWSGVEGSTIKRLYNENILNTEIALPSLLEQKAIGIFFSTLDRQITLHQRKLDKLKNVKQAYLSEMFPAEGERVPKRRFPGFTDDWELRKLGNTDTIFTDGNYGEAYPKDSDLTTSSNGVPFLRGSNIQDGKLNLDNANYITISKHNELTSGHLEEDDIVIAVRGSLGSVGYVEEDNIGWNINSQLAIIRTNKDEITGRYLIQILLSDSGKKMINSLVTGTALKQLPIKNLKKIQFSIPTLPEQKAIATFFSTLDRQITLHQRKLEKLKNLKKALLNELFV